MLCKKCGNNVAETAKFCGKCGETIAGIPPVADADSSSAHAGKSGIVAGILLVVLIAAVASWFIFNKSEPAAETAQVTLEESGAGTPPQPAESSSSEQEAAPEAETQTTPSVTSTSVSSVPADTSKKSANKDVGQKPAQTAAKEQQAKPVAAQTTKPVAVKTIDAVYSERSAKECAEGVSGFFCRESLRISLCEGRWSEHPPEWEKLCRLNKLAN
jgi:cytoskeletal protein RodZ